MRFVLKRLAETESSFSQVMRYSETEPALVGAVFRILFKSVANNFGINRIMDVFIL